MTPRLIAVMGPTASGKSALAERAADRLGARLVNADAFQVYRGFDIGTAKPSRQDYALVDICDPHDQFGLGEFLRLATGELERAWEQGRDVVVVGGTGLYVRALTEEYASISPSPPPELRSEVSALSLGEAQARLRHLSPEVELDWRNPARVRRALERAILSSQATSVRLPPFEKLKVVLSPDPAELELRTNARVQRMFDAGWVREVNGLLARGVSQSDPAFRAIGYDAIRRYLGGLMTLGETKQEICLVTRKYAKRQRTWLRAEPNVCRVWPDVVIADQADSVVDLLLER